MSQVCACICVPGVQVGSFKTILYIHGSEFEVKTRFWQSNFSLEVFFFSATILMQCCHLATNLFEIPSHATLRPKHNNNFWAI